MKKGQNTNYEKAYFNSGINGSIPKKNSRAILLNFLNETQSHKKCKNISRKSKTKKRK